MSNTGESSKPLDEKAKAAMVKGHDAAMPYVYAIVSVVIVVVIAIVAIDVGLPDRDNTQAIVHLIGFAAPTVAALLALLKTQETHVLVNSRMSDLLNATERAARAQALFEQHVIAEKARAEVQQQSPSDDTSQEA